MAVSAVPTVTRHLFDVDDYHRMAEIGILNEDSRVELIEGEIVDMSPNGPWHLSGVDILNERFVQALAGRAIVRTQGSVRLNQRLEPQPDLALLRWRPDYYRGGHAGPSDILLLVEVADSSLAYDREVKSRLYARSGIPEYWLVDVNGHCVTVYREPGPCGYREVTEARGAERLSPLAFPDLALTVEEIVGGAD
jgi:Uma2 family endonuclease